MGTIEPQFAWQVFQVIAWLAILIMTYVRTKNSGKRNPSVDTNLGTIDTRVETLETGQRENSRRIEKLDDKLSMRVGALHGRMNDMFGELQKMEGGIEFIKHHLEKSK